MNYYLLRHSHHEDYKSRGGYIPSYSRGFITAGSLFFHKSGQIWELVGLPKSFWLYCENDCYVNNGKTVLVKVGNFPQRAREIMFPDAWMLRFGPRSKVVALRRDSDEVLRLRWRRVSLAEVKAREMMWEMG